MSSERIIVKRRNILSPLTTGGKIDVITFKKEHLFNFGFTKDIKTNQGTLYGQSLRKPLVINFHAGAWGIYGSTQLKHFDSLRHAVRAAGGNSLTVTPDPRDVLEKVSWDNNLSVSFYTDPQNSIAKKFKVYNESLPTWHKYTGIDGNVPLLATYVLNVDYQIKYAYVDHTLTGEFPADQILDAVKSCNSLGC